MNECVVVASPSLNGSNKVGVSPPPQQPQGKGRKNKRKLADPSQPIITDAASLTEFPPYELHSLKFQNPLSENSQDSESLGWDDPFACYLEELLSSNLMALFRNAMDQVVACGYREDVVLKAISGSRLYCGGNDLVSNIVNDTLSFLKSGKKVSGLRDYVFEDLQQLVAYTLVEKISLVKEVRPSVSTVEAMWRLLMCDLNVFQAFEMEGDGLEGVAECNPTKLASDSSDNNNKTNQSEPVKFGNFPNVTNYKNSHDSSSGEVTKRKTSVVASGEKLVSGRKGRTKKEVAMMRQKSCVDKIRTYSKGSGYKTAKYASVGGFLVEKRGKSPSDLGSKITSSEGHNNTKSDLPLIDGKGYVTALPAINAPPAPLASEKKSGEKGAADYYTGIPYDASLGIFVPRNKRDELVLKLAPRVKDLQSELQVWTDWANQKVKQATSRLLKDQPELKALRKEKEEAEEFRKEKQLLEESNMKRRSEMEFALNNMTRQLEKANNTVRRLELEQSLLKKEREVANIRAAEAAASCIEAKERVQKTLKSTQSWEGQKALLQEELKSQRDKVAELQQEVAKAKIRQNQIEATWKQEMAAKEKLVAQATALQEERVKLEELGKAEEERIKTKAENDVRYYTENIKRLESEISKLKLKSDCLKIAALKKGIDGSNEGSKNGTTRTNTTTKASLIWENSNGTEAKIKRERECVMCLSEEMSVIFLPCAHQVLCSKCNQLHEKEAMEDCPSCRAKIQRRIQARFARG
ncbi:putative E3 ubiquitin-protein ligase RF298 [Raphanus sativus]|uniref:E3 ubiquitin-protein ligase RF298 n=1 Tax=Raphanus sativus TaxID=3726 RepID=A0A6J0LD54_RAPSA|nr:putative E3 ubiquitin-protein ligase RF298 [Raphanus sativus]XP_056851462.1 putative E3 ubiquitin-protein ligase RF298 [Raphanus sativus]KAJ4876539.1 putative E3 ubiquitin-protein ligase RF298 [Raphanus sativus]